MREIKIQNSHSRLLELTVSLTVKTLSFQQWRMAVFVSSSDALSPGWLVTHLKGYNLSEIKEKQKFLAKYSRHFVYSNPAQPLGPEALTWRMIAGKLVNIKLHIRRSQRVVQRSRSICTCECRRSNSSTPGPLS